MAAVLTPVEEQRGGLGHRLTFDHERIVRDARRADLRAKLEYSARSQHEGLTHPEFDEVHPASSSRGERCGAMQLDPWTTSSATTYIASPSRPSPFPAEVVTTSYRGSSSIALVHRRPTTQLP